jgi:phage gpG-like protein
VATKFKKPTKSRVAQEIDLEELFGVSFKGARALREAIGQAIIDKMLERTSRGLGMRFNSDGTVGREINLNAVRGKGGKPGYSKQYVSSDEFQAFGKSKNRVNMELTGDMLSSIDILRQSSSTIEIGINDDTEAKKAFNHTVGDTVPSRPFLGVNKRELKEIKSEFQSDVKSALKAKQSEGRKAFEAAILNIIDKFKDETGG